MRQSHSSLEVSHNSEEIYIVLYLRVNSSIIFSLLKFHFIYIFLSGLFFTRSMAKFLMS